MAYVVDWKTIKVPEMAYLEAKEAKGDNETWAEFIKRCADEPQLQMSEQEVRRIVREEIEKTARR